jgi:hypothetical protein
VDAQGDTGTSTRDAVSGDARRATDSGVGLDADSATAPTDAGATLEASLSDGGYYPPIVTTPFTDLVNDTWVWEPLAGAICRDGTPTGIGVNLHSGSPNLMIYLEGGGSCDQAKKCGTCEGQTDHTADGAACTPLNYTAQDFASFAAGSHSGSVFDRTNTASPVHDWSLVYVPYCTGDDHGGNNPGGHPPGEAPQQFVGYVDVALALGRLVPTFSNVTEVLLTGESAGGAGVELNYLQTAAAFAHAKVDALDDSGPPMPTPYLAACEQEVWKNLWRFDRTWMPLCGPSGCAVDGGAAIGLAELMASKYPNSTFGVADAIDDGTIAANYGGGLDDCAGFPPDASSSPEPAAMFADGQYAIRSRMASHPNFGTYLFPGSAHTTLARTVNEAPDYAERVTSPDAGSVLFTTWMGELVNGSVPNVGP